MTRVFSFWRTWWRHAAVAGAGVLILFSLFHLPPHLRARRQVRERMMSMAHLIRSSFPVHKAAGFRAWLDQADLKHWTAGGCHLAWLGPDGSVRWTLSAGFSFHKLPPDVSRAVKEVRPLKPDLPPPAFLPGAHQVLYGVEPLDPDDPTAGVLLLRATLPSFFLDAPDLWLAATACLLLALTVFFIYRRRVRRRFHDSLQEISRDHPLPPLQSNDTLEGWTRRIISATHREIDGERDLFASLFDLLQDGILLLDFDLTILRGNAAAAAMLDVNAIALDRMKLADIPGHEPLARFAAELREPGSLLTDELQLPAVADPCLVAGASLPAGDDTAQPHLMIVMRDITKLRRLESAGEEYATNVSHELKTPLTLIIGYTETLLEHPDLDPEFRARSLRTIEHHARRIIRIVDDLLRLAWLRNESGISGIPRAAVPVDAVLNEAVSLCEEWGRSAGIAIEVSAPPDLTWSLNRGLIEEAIVNLVKNAILYALEGPVEVRAQTLSNGFLELSVTDRGPGLQPEDAARIFDRFYRVDKSRSRASGGSGLGLPIVQQIVEAHQGSARVETAPGAGCTFILEFPPGPAPEA